MNGLHEIVVEGVTEIIDNKSADQYKAVRGCESRAVLMALTGLIAIGAVGIGKANAVEGRWISKKAADAMPKVINDLGALLDPDETLEALAVDLEVDVDETPGAMPGTLPDGFTALDEWSEVEAGDGIDDAGSDKPKRETLAELRERVKAGVKYIDDEGKDQTRKMTAEELAAEISAEEAHEDGARKGPVKWLKAQIRKRERAAEKAKEKAAKAKEKAKAKAAKAEERAKAKAAKAAKREEEKRKKAEEREKSSAFYGLPHLPDDGDPLPEDEDRTCPKCKEVKPVGEGFGYRVMRRVVMHPTGRTIGDELTDGTPDPYAGQEIYIKAVRVTTRNQSQCKSCRGSKSTTDAA